MQPFKRWCTWLWDKLTRRSRQKPAAMTVPRQALRGRAEWAPQPPRVREGHRRASGRHRRDFAAERRRRRIAKLSRRRNRLA